MRIKTSDMNKTTDLMRVIKNGVVVARVTPEGIMQFKVDASDENAEAFVNYIEKFLAGRITGIEVVISSCSDCAHCSVERNVTSDGWDRYDVHSCKKSGNTLEDVNTIPTDCPLRRSDGSN